MWVSVSVLSCGGVMFQWFNSGLRILHWCYHVLEENVETFGNYKSLLTTQEIILKCYIKFGHNKS